MFNKKMKWKKGIAVMAATALTVGMLSGSSVSLYDLNGKMGTVQAETIADKENVGKENPSILQVRADFFDYNISFCQKGDKTITASNQDKILLNQYTKQEAPQSAVREKKLFLFGGKRTGDGEQNKWTGAKNAQYEGIVKPQMVDGNIQFNNENGVYGVNIFPSQEEYAAAVTEKGELTLQDVIKPYYGKEFQFIYNPEAGNYIFDSGKHGISGVSEEGKVAIDFENPGPVFGSGTGTNKSITGFFPFNSMGEDNQAGEGRHHMFGMKLTIPFVITESGRVMLEDGTEKDMIFNFSGDDDVWIFIDGNLAIDLGGIHDKTSARINFATGEISYEQSASGGTSYGIKNIYEDKVVSPSAITTGSTGKSTSHTLTMFYLERGEFDSNCSINFNIPAEGEVIKPTSTPIVTTTPAITMTPMVTTAPAITTSPSVTTEVPTTKAPVVPTKVPATKTPVATTPIKTNPPVTTEPKHTLQPTKVPETEKPKTTKTPVKETTSPTKTPTSTPVVTVMPTVAPTIDINGSAPTEDVIIEETKVPDAYVTPEPTVEVTVAPELTPVVTDEPIYSEEPTVVPTGTPVIIEEPENPSSTVDVLATPEVEMVETPNEEDTVEFIDEDETPNENPKDDVEVIVEEEVPSILPKTGALGVLAKNNHVVWYGLLFVEAVVAATIGILQTRKRKKK